MTDNPNPSAGSREGRHEIAKGVLAAAKTPAECERAIQTAMEMGMPLHQIEEYLDWLEQHRLTPDDQEGPAEERSNRGRRPKPR